MIIVILIYFIPLPYIYAAIDLIIMLAYNKSSLNQLYNNNKKYKHQYELITSGLAWNRYLMSNHYSKQYNAYSFIIAHNKLFKSNGLRKQ